MKSMQHNLGSKTTKTGAAKKSDALRVAEYPVTSHTPRRITARQSQSHLLSTIK
jgi:hypothetical protein